MGRQPGWMVTQTGQLSMRSPGRPPVRREIEQAFWRKIAEGRTSEDAGVAVGVSGPVGSRWFRERGGMPSTSLDAPSGRYLPFAEREEIALLNAQNHGVREISRRIGRSPSTTISRELRRNAATRSGKMKYRAGVAQWKAELAARRPKTAKLVANPQLVGTSRSGWLVRSAVPTARWSQARGRRRGRVATSHYGHCPTVMPAPAEGRLAVL
jgi:hypothetical protein